LVELLGCPEVAEDERFGSTDQRVNNRDDLKVILDGGFIKNTTQA
jgi:succinate--hydroxymethylglutarate CoA-transferase